MKRRDLVRHLRAHDCEFLREGGNHEIWINLVSKRRAAVARHREVTTYTAETICKELDIPPPERR